MKRLVMVRLLLHIDNHMWFLLAIQSSCKQDSFI